MIDCLRLGLLIDDVPLRSGTHDILMHTSYQLPFGVLVWWPPATCKRDNAKFRVRKNDLFLLLHIITRMLVYDLFPMIPRDIIDHILLKYLKFERAEYYVLFLDQKTCMYYRFPD